MVRNKRTFSGDSGELDRPSPESESEQPDPVQHSPTPVVERQKPIASVAPIRPNVPIQRPEPVPRRTPDRPIATNAAPVRLAESRQAEPAKSEGKTIPESSQKEFGKEFGNNSPNNSETIRDDNPEPAPVLDMAPYKKKGKVGRQRKYEEPGNHGEIPVKKVVLYRHIKGRHWPGMSQDMREWYEFYYFSRPKRTEKAKDAEDYTRHVKSWERGQGWIADYEASQGRDYDTGTLGNSGKIVAYRKRANG